MDVLYALRRARQFHPEEIAADDGARPITFAQFADRAARVAQVLRDMGVQPGDRVAVLMLNSPRYFELHYAVPLAGAIVVPINIRWNPAEIGFCLSDCGARLLVVDDYFARAVPALSAALPGLQFLNAADYEARQEAASPVSLEGPLPDDDAVVALFYTAGPPADPRA